MWRKYWQGPDSTAESRTTATALPCARQCGVASCQDTRHPKSERNAVFFEPDSLTVYRLTVHFLCGGCPGFKKATSKICFLFQTE